MKEKHHSEDITLQNVLDDAADYLQKQDVDLIEKAYYFSEKAHKGQFRKSGREYIYHPMMVAYILVELKQDTPTICAGLLHDTVEDTPVTEENLEAEFGKDIAQLVFGVTKLGRIQFRSKEEEQAENFRKMFLAMAKDVRVVIIKLADRLHNMRTLKHLPPEKQGRIARETRDIFSPLAHRMGMWSVKWEMEDLAFEVLQPDDFQSIRSMVQAKRESRLQYVDRMRETILNILNKNDISGDVSGRPKHFYSIYKKLKKQNISFDELFDTLGLRIIVDTIPDCYKTLGVIHAEYKPLSGRIKDYIAVPKSNMYQSLHTTVMGPEGKPVEIQIRTYEMHEIAEYGVAAHWSYKEGRESKKDASDFTWLRELVDAQSDRLSAGDFMQELKLDLFIDEVFVFTPQGDIKVMPKGATPVDFAYRIHTEVGHQCTGAKINSHIVPLDHVLHSGDRVEIMTGKESRPKLDWLHFVATAQAKNRIKQWFRRQKSKENIAFGSKQLEKVLLVNGFSPKATITDAAFPSFQDRFKVESFDELYLHIAQGEISPKEVLTFLRSQDVLSPVKADPTFLKEIPPRYRKPAQDGIRVVGEDNISIRVAKCCQPVPGDTIVGFITLGTGVSVHRKNCHHMLTLTPDKTGRLIEVEWDLSKHDHRYPVAITIEAFDGSGVIQDILQKISDYGAHISQVSSRVTEDGGSMIIMIGLDINDLKQLGQITTGIQGLPDVISVQRENRT